MNGPRRLRDGDDAGAQLLRAAHDDAPPSGAKGRAAVALGLAAGAGSALATSTAAAATSALSLVKTIGVLLVGSAIAAGTIYGVAHESTVPPSAPTAAPNVPPVASPQVPAQVPESHAAADNPVDTPPVDTTPNVTVPARAAPTPLQPRIAALPSASAVAPVKPAATTLADEVAALDRARGALAAGRWEEALRDLDAYRVSFPSGLLAPEASVLRIEALAAAGRCADASREASAFLARSPGAPQAARVRSLVDACAQK
jgi:hypothetical protein